MMGNNIPENIVNNYAAGLVYINAEENILDERDVSSTGSVSMLP